MLRRQGQPAAHAYSRASAPVRPLAALCSHPAHTHARTHACHCGGVASSASARCSPCSSAVRRHHPAGSCRLGPRCACGTAGRDGVVLGSGPVQAAPVASAWLAKGTGCSAMLWVVMGGYVAGCAVRAPVARPAAAVSRPFPSTAQVQVCRYIAGACLRVGCTVNTTARHCPAPNRVQGGC